jgi:N-acetylneuraminic acid mutarotase
MSMAKNRWSRRLPPAATGVVLLAACGPTAPDDEAPPPDVPPVEAPREGEQPPDDDPNGNDPNGDPDDTDPNSDDPDPNSDDPDSDAPNGNSDDADPAGDESAEGAWTALPDAPIAPRLNHSVTWTDDRVVVWGGEDQDRLEITADGAAFDPATDTWEEVPEAPIEPRWAHEAIWTGERLLVWGGTAGPDHLAACHGDGALYDPATTTWETISGIPGESRCDASIAWTGDELIVSGGHAGEGPPGPGDRHDDTWAYDPTEDEWRSLPDSPLGPRAGAVAGWVSGELVIYGGHTGAEDDGFTYLADGAAYDPDGDEWRRLPDASLPPLSGIHGVVIDDSLLVFGGQDPDPEADGHSTVATAYDPAADTWETLQDTPGAHESLESTWTGDVLYVIGGGLPGPGGTDDEPAGEPAPPFLAYVADEDLWLPRQDPPDGYRTHHAMAWTGTELIVWGGQHEDGPATGLRWQPPTERPGDDPPPEDPRALPTTELTAWVDEAPANLNHRIAATVTDDTGAGDAGVPVRFEVYRDEELVLTVDRETEADGEVLFSYNAGARPGDTDLVVACVVGDEVGEGEDVSHCAEEADRNGDPPSLEPVQDPPADGVTVGWGEQRPADHDPAGSEFFGEAIAIDPAEQALEVQLLPQDPDLGAFVAFDYTDEADYELAGEPVSMEVFACAIERTVEDDAAEQRVTISLTPPEVMSYLLTTSAEVDDCL